VSFCLDSLLLRVPPLAVPAPARRLDWPTLSGSEDAFRLAQLATQQRQPLLIVTAEAQEAARLAEEIAAFAPGLGTRLLPDWETLPYDQFSPHQDLVSERLETLWEAHRGRCRALVVPAANALARLAPPAFLAAFTFLFKQGETLDADTLRLQLAQAGYAAVTQVVSPGEFAVRGGLIDLYPMGSPVPYRIDLFDDEIDSIKAFDADTQRTLYPVAEIRLLPAREFPLDDKGRALFRQQFRERFENDPTRARVYKDISRGLTPAGIEYYLPLFFEQTATLFDYLPADAIVALHGNVAAAFARFAKETQSRYAMLAGDAERPLLPPEALFLSDEEFFLAAKTHPRLSLSGQLSLPVQVAADHQKSAPFAALKTFVEQFPGEVRLLAESEGRKETLAQTLSAQGLPGLPIDIAGLHAGLLLEEPPLSLLTEAELYAGTPRKTRSGRKKQRADNWLRDLSELQPGDPVVHETHGVGRYLGLAKMALAEGEQEFLELSYADDARLFVPVAQLALISRYTGADAEHAPLSRLGSGQWEKARKKAARQARDTAAELLALYAKRAARQGHAFSFSETDYETFADGFEFEETADQTEAIAAVLADMRAEKPMDRLVCGDVGFGKTEVALRAAFCAVAGGRQVAVLCPTTLLCQQHFQSFSDRFSRWPIRIAELSRFRTAKESAAALKELEAGSLDIVIGTHKLIQKDVKFARLGLIVIDEEHRFGVRQKEALKALRAQVDVLTLTATPIPRTLAMSLEGLRDFSVIATAPQKRLAIKTFVRPKSPGIVVEAIRRELNRGGQVYFLHNEVDTIEHTRQRLAELVPEAKIVVGHGQMHERELEKVMRDFMAQRANVLLCTTIIETGIDNPHANTILIDRADRFGLAQLHQLRGRVGRSHHQAYAYLLVPDALGKQAGQRLEAIASMEELGSGFYLAMHDLEIRGAGEVLGENQSGAMQDIGFSLYTEMLNRAVAAMKRGQTPSDEELTAPPATTDINLHTPAFLPDAYCPDVLTRLNLYKRLSHAKDDEELDALQEELIDRFGKLPPEGEALLALHRLRLLVEPFCVQKLDLTGDAATLTFSPAFAQQAPFDPARIIRLIQTDRRCKLAGQDKLSLTTPLPDLPAKVAAVKKLFSVLADGGEITGNAKIIHNRSN
jgi:transcription-repair coupling factor (superfamily II helicase)